MGFDYKKFANGIQRLNDLAQEKHEKVQRDNQRYYDSVSRYYEYLSDQQLKDRFQNESESKVSRQAAYDEWKKRKG